jgi:pimeloyl-ACP methyl ester carboxylesterase
MNNRVQIGNLNISYTRLCRSKNPKGTIVFLHGWGGSSESWEPNTTPLSEMFDCIAVDFPGFGKSGEPEEIWNVPEYAAFVRAFVQKLGIHKFSLIGKSFGGRVAIYYAATWPESLETLVLVAAAGIEKKSLKVYLKILAAKAGKLILSLVDKRKVEDVRSKFYSNAGIERDQSDYKWLVKKKVTNTNLSKLASRIQVPTLIVWGSDDKVLPIRWGRELHRRVKGSIFKQLIGGHNAHQESAGEFNKLIGEFLS